MLQFCTDMIKVNEGGWEESPKKSSPWGKGRYNVFQNATIPTIVQTSKTITKIGYFNNLSLTWELSATISKLSFLKGFCFSHTISSDNNFLMVNFLVWCFTFVRQNLVPRRWSCDEIFWNAEARQVEQIFDHLSLDVMIQLRGRVKTA